MIIAETQTMGRGQYGKKWISYNGNLFVSFFYELKILISIYQSNKNKLFISKKIII